MVLLGEDSNDCYSLEIHDELVQEDIVTRYAIDAKTANIVINLNHSYKDKNINIHIKNYENVENLRKALKRLLVKEKGIDEKQATMLADVIDNNRQMIEDAYYRYDKKKDNGNKEGGEGSNVNSDLDSDDGGDDDVDDIGGNGDGKPPSESETILSRLQDGNLIHELFVDQYNTPYAAIKVKDHIETISMRTKASTQFKNWICYNMYSGMGLVPKDESLNNVLNVLRARATYEGKIRKLYLRVGPSPNLDSDSNSDLGDVDDNGDDNGATAITTTATTSNTTTAITAIEEEGKHNEILYDLTNKNWEFVRINADGWSIEKYVDTTPIFKRYRNQSAQMYPSKKYPE